jgi:hypothetical protein
MLMVGKPRRMKKWGGGGRCGIIIGYTLMNSITNWPFNFKRLIMRALRPNCMVVNGR